jgi:hypothetical protein
MLNWKYIDNQFEVATRTSYKKSLILSNYHDAALLTRQGVNPAYAPIYDRYHPLHLELVAQYSAWKSAGGAQQGQTLSLEQQLAASYDKVDDWDVAVQVVYRKTTPQYKAIFPDGRKPFRRGSLEQRINAFKTLGINIGADPALATVKAQVDAAYDMLDEIRDAQQGAKGNVKDGSSMLDAARVAAMDMQYRNLGFVMDTFYPTRETECAIIFDLQTLRESDQRTFTSTLDPEETEQLLVHTFLPDDVLKAKIDTNGPISLYLASTPGGINSTAVVLSSTAEVSIPVSAFGDIDLATHRYLTAVSAADAVTKLRITLE